VNGENNYSGYPVCDPEIKAIIEKKYHLQPTSNARVKLSTAHNYGIYTYYI
jgi:hypothetical protein